MTETDLIREQLNITMFNKLILQLKSDRISFTVLMIGFSSACRWNYNANQFWNDFFIRLLC